MIVSCCNQNGGLWSTDDGLICEDEARGIVNVDGRIYFATKKGLCEFHRSEQTSTLLWGETRDWHGLTHHEGRLWMVCPIRDLLTEHDLEGRLLGQYTYAKETGRMHTNDITFHKGAMYQCNFTQGICKDGVPLGLAASMKPHSVVFWKDRLTFCASAKGEVWVEDKSIARWSNCFPRGLLPEGDVLWVGRGRHRHTQDNMRLADIACIDDEGEVQDCRELPTSETYAMCLS